MDINLLVAKSRQKKALLAGLLITVAVSAVIGLLDSAQLFQRLEWMSYDWRMSELRSHKVAPDDIAVILVDDASLQAMNSVVGRWPWPRSVFADLIEFLSYGDPKSIIFDMLFVEAESAQRPSSSGLPSARNNNDERLINATRDSGSVIHAMQFITNHGDEFSWSQPIAELPQPLVDRLSLKRAPSWLPAHPSTLMNTGFNSYLIPIDGLRQAAANIGVVSVNADRDGILRRTPLLFPYQDKIYPALSLAPLLSEPLDSKANTKGTPPESGIPLDANGNYLINQYGGFNTYSASGLLASIDRLQRGDVEKMLVNPEEFTGKYVFIGASAIGLHDLINTPVSDNLPGVMIHASVLGNLLQHDYLHPAQPLHTITALLLLCLLTTMAVTLLRHIALKIVIPVALAACYIALSLWAFHNNQVLETVAPLAAVAACWAVAYSYLLFTEGKEKHKIRTMFSRYVSPAALAVMVDQYEDYVAAAEGSTETVTVLFSDIRGFTKLSESIPPERVVKMLNHYFASMTEAVFNHRGTIDKFIGDAIMAIWGAPIRSHTHASDALAAANEMMQRLAEVNAWLSDNHFEPLNIGIGLNSGPVILGSIGSESKADYTVIGDNVNLASRLEGLTKVYGCNILLSENTFNQLNATVPCRIVDLVRVKGKQEPIRIFTPVTNSVKPEEIAEISQRAFHHYRQQDWKQALQLYLQLPDDALSRLYRSRITHYQAHPPATDWDGVHTMSTK